MAIKTEIKTILTCDRCKEEVSYFVLRLEKKDEEPIPGTHFESDRRVSVADLCTVCTELFAEFMKGR